MSGGHGHHHAGFCGGIDHHTGRYTAEQRADLDRVLAFNARLAGAIDSGADVRPTLDVLDPDPLRYMWVDEGQGRLAEVLTRAGQVLDQAPPLSGHRRGRVSVVDGSRRAARPSVAAAADESVLCCWVEWVPDEGDVLQATLLKPDGSPVLPAPTSLSSGVSDIFRPTAVFAADGTAWVFFGRREDGWVHVWATYTRGSVWSEPHRVTTSEHPSFNQEATAHADGRVELCWQGRRGGRFGIFSRVWDRGVWKRTELVSEGVEANVWDPAVVACGDGGSAYAWSEYREGSYRVVVRRRDAAGQLGECRQITSGNDYALHPSLAVTSDQRLWCAFDVITVSGHGGSGPTQLRPAERLASGPGRPDGVREAGESVPAELLPEVEATMRVVEVDDDCLREPPGVLADGLRVVPSGLPRLVATRDGGLVVAYRVHRQLPLMTYYWEVAAQALGADGWCAPTTFQGSDGTLEEVSVAEALDGVVVAAQSDGRLERALRWTEGFGGRECPYLMEHQGSVVWHGVHDVGVVVLGSVGPAGRAPDALASTRSATVHADRRTESRRWVGGGSADERYTARLGDGREYTLFWGDLHRHSLVSRCTAGDEPSLEDFYRYSWDVCEYDFWAVTDHAENSSDYQWWTIQKIADLFHIPERFVPLYGFEWTSPDTGHQNVIYGDVQRGAPIFSAFAEGTTDPAGLWEALARHPDYPAITIPHHPGAAMVHHDWDYHDARFGRLVEVFQACRGNYEAPGAFRQYADATREGTFVVDGLLRGHRFGLIASSDHGHGASYVGAFAESLSRGSVFDALHSRRTFAATTRGIVLDVRLDGAFLGEEIATDRRELHIHAEAYTDLARVDIVRNGQVVNTFGPDLGLPPGWVAVPVRLEWGESDRPTTWDGELTVRGGRIVQTPYWSPEVVEAAPQRVRWQHQAHSFGEPYGAQRGGVELTITGPPDAVVRISTAGRHAELPLADLERTGRQELPGEPGRFFVQHGTGGLSSMGTTTVDLGWVDETREAAFYYVRVFQVDGEMAWSSPIWVSATHGDTA